MLAKFKNRIKSRIADSNTRIPVSAPDPTQQPIASLAAKDTTYMGPSLSSGKPSKKDPAQENVLQRIKRRKAKAASKKSKRDNDDSDDGDDGDKDVDLDEHRSGDEGLGSYDENKVDASDDIFGEDSEHVISDDEDQEDVPDV